MATFRRAARRLDRIARAVEDGGEELTAEVAIAIGAELVQATRVDTGRARANWRASIDVPIRDSSTQTDPAGFATAGEISRVALRYREGQDLYIVNRVPYIGVLAARTSFQGQSGWIRSAIDDGFSKGVRQFSDGIIGRVL